MHRYGVWKGSHEALFVVRIARAAVVREERHAASRVELTQEIEGPDLAARVDRQQLAGLYPEDLHDLPELSNRCAARTDGRDWEIKYHPRGTCIAAGQRFSLLWPRDTHLRLNRWVSPAIEPTEQPGRSFALGDADVPAVCVYPPAPLLPTSDSALPSWRRRSG